MNKPLRFGHRGASGYFPENTLAAFQKAIDLGVDMVELDVHRCKTGEIVVMHDDTVDRTTNGYGRVADLALDALRMLDAGQGERVVTLEEVLDMLDHRVGAVVELKEAEVIEPTAEIINRYISEKGWAVDQFSVTAFDHYLLRTFHKLCPRVRLGAILAGNPIGYAEFGQRLGAASVNMAHPFLTQEFVYDAHERGLQVFAWPVDEPRDIERMKSIGVDGIFSNFPDRI
ncbi:MAG: Glycerophosphoryl diester phosphodiesterase [Candidatus Wolfebacteria bacterium GW2011_GWE1_48_7]|uniref:Glycerophosphoryl diester phosphodiesterase n=2 Tax=Candidatus Wolfeibacteriota TaxID=1752735 RepID=A0A0G1U833_9BACT|nr:MAG: glycerophosphoryl diester phosphodiesterase, glycerophosphoryl diester phosphodiesterase [Candidatus Wolfebacteria bacterium GW2011_GWB1_47_1]KKU34514.1 MAG: Glycerophosphoryl diester phosphodiesterase [Candidatus Wolfebacteria bacterium GW2011_GWC2_46_275]KKU42528.1 MAG: Glycerophosphoryl diester phosphodiesterase [Candidatus Wolfebacteria bacterium GW2011_GWB2_46_69]KKU53905.1 MAG: Glycerophosphoryl diester phosphodiesterase [Candidatus Wolfebacteria bacterium GW2011_GWC1_47_103]KKU59